MAERRKDKENPDRERLVPRLELMGECNGVEFFRLTSMDRADRRRRAKDSP